jgi:NADH:ubiquinone oxidoreductase subunit 2 (subunit N)
MAWENSLLVTALVPLLGSFTLPLLGLWSPRVRNLWAIFLGCVTFFSALPLLPEALSGESLVFSFPIGMGLDALFLLMVSGMNGLVLTTDLFNMYVFLEVAAVSSYALVVFGQKQDGIEAAFKYLMLSAVATTGILIALGIQPKRIDFDAPLSNEVSSSIQEVVNVLRTVL